MKELFEKRRLLDSDNGPLTMTKFTMGYALVAFFVCIGTETSPAFFLILYAAIFALWLLWRTWTALRGWSMVRFTIVYALCIAAIGPLLVPGVEAVLFFSGLYAVVVVLWTFLRFLRGLRRA